MPKRKPSQTPKRDNLTVAELSNGLGISQTMVDRCTARGMPRTSIEAAQKWRSENIKTRSARPVDMSEAGIELQRARIADLLESARRRKMLNDKTEARLIRRDEVQADIATSLDRLTKRLSTLPAEAASVVPVELAESIRDLVSHECELSLDALRNDIGHIAGS
jgi:hypothetical protein